MEMDFFCGKIILDVIPENLKLNSFIFYLVIFKMMRQLVRDNVLLLTAFFHMMERKCICFACLK